MLISYIAGFIFPYTWLAIIRKELYSIFNFHKQKKKRKKRKRMESTVHIRKTFMSGYIKTGSKLENHTEENCSLPRYFLYMFRSDDSITQSVNTYI